MTVGALILVDLAIVTAVAQLSGSWLQTIAAGLILLRWEIGRIPDVR